LFGWRTRYWNFMLKLAKDTHGHAVEIELCHEPRAEPPECCPFVPGLQREDWSLEDPKGKPLERVREIRDDIRQRVDELLRVHEWQRGTT